MSKLIPATSSTEAWLKGLAHLQTQDEWRDYNLILEISKPMGLSPNEKQIATDFSKFLAAHEKKPISTVINTIFPASLYAGQTAEVLFKQYMEITPELCKHPDNKKWGTYFMRIAARTDENGLEVRPLERMIDRLRKQANSKSPKRAWYELNFVDPFLEIPIYDNIADPRFMMGGPCLSHLSFKLRADRSLILTAFYRSHYYIERTLGNLFGLAMLQDFVAKETGLKTAELVCHSSMAQIDFAAPFGKAKIEKLIAKYQKMAVVEPPVNPPLTATRH